MELTRHPTFTPNNTEEESEVDDTPQSKIVKTEILKNEDETIYEKPKRKRHRKRKNKSPVAVVDETYKPKIAKNPEFSFQKEKPKVHLKFEDNQSLDEILQQSTRLIEALSEIKEIEDVELLEEKPEENIVIFKEKTQELSDEPPRIIMAIIDDNVQKEKEKEENLPVAIEKTETVFKTKESALETLRNNLKNLDIPLLKELPKTGEIIAFKILAMSENYVPEISDYMIGLIESINMETKYLKIVIMGKLLIPFYLNTIIVFFFLFSTK